MPTERRLLALSHHPPHARVPEAALRDVVAAGIDATRVDGLDRTVVFDAATRRLRLETWPADDRPGLIHLADITTDAAP
jgi:hypothetical protein